jgi:hypothetical protein
MDQSAPKDPSAQAFPLYQTEPHRQVMRVRTTAKSGGKHETPPHRDIDRTVELRAVVNWNVLTDS